MDFIMIEHVREIFCRTIIEGEEEFVDNDQFRAYVSGACEMLEGIVRATAATAGEKEAEVHGRYL